MTVPIMPGPFSFLASAGQALGRIKEEQNAEQDKRRKIAQDKLNQMISLRGAGLIGPEAFSSREAMDLYNELGVMPISDKPTVSERKDQLTEQFMAAPQSQSVQMPSVGLEAAGIPMQSVPVQRATAGPQSLSDEQRAVIGVPSRSAMAREKLAQGAGHQAEIAQVENTRDMFYNTVAGRSVDAAIMRAGGDLEKIGPAGMPAVADAAWTLMQQDARSRGYTLEESITRPYIEAQLRTRLNELEKLQVERMRAANQSQGSDNALYALLQRQATIAQNQLNNLPEIDQMTRGMAMGYAAKLAKATEEERIMLTNDPKYAEARRAYDTVELDRVTRATLMAQINALRENTQSVIAGAVPGAAPGIPTQQTQSLDAATINQYVQTLISGQGTIEQLTQAMQDGDINPTDFAMIIGQYTAAKTTQSAAKPAKKPTPVGGAQRNSSSARSPAAKGGASPYYPDPNSQGR